MQAFGKVVLVAVSVAAVMIAGATESIADGDQDGGVFDRQETVNASDGSLRITEDVRMERAPDGNRRETTARPIATEQVESDTATGAAFCADASADVAAGGGVGPEIEALCGFLPVVGRQVVPGRGVVATAFREIALYRGAVRTDPERASLVNLETYFWCGDAEGRSCVAIGEGERTVTLLGQAVRIRPRIVSYDWRFGDGSGQRVTAGRAVHTYGEPGIMPVSVTLTWTADYAVGGGQFQALGETTTTTSPIRLLPVREAEAVIVTGG